PIPVGQQYPEISSILLQNDWLMGAPCCLGFSPLGGLFAGPLVLGLWPTRVCSLLHESLSIFRRNVQ
ncbi:MAG TPA: hypothetical protein VEC13_02365, partial [Candidatus Paceibacterota bacterium]|nr:hypothetical protein [Candidatus Paceibacterota bacterium]